MWSLHQQIFPKVNSPIYATPPPSRVNHKITLRPKQMRQTKGNFVRIFTLCAGNIRFGIHQEIAGQTDDALVRPTTGGRWQFRRCGCGDVYTDHGKIAAVEFPNVRATATGDGLRSVGVGVLADAATKFNGRIHIKNDNQADAGKRQEQNTVHIR